MTRVTKYEEVHAFCLFALEHGTLGSQESRDSEITSAFSNTPLALILRLDLSTANVIYAYLTIFLAAVSHFSRCARIFKDSNSVLELKGPCTNAGSVYHISWMKTNV